jgi:alpha/beta superfamily hydrolase
MGGDRHNIVVSALFAALPKAGVTAFRFDFSSSDVPTAAAETEAVLALAAGDAPPAFVVGYSFGGGVAATVTTGSVAGWYLVAPALSAVAPTIGSDPRPKGIAVAEHDQWFGPAAVRAATSGWTSTSTETISGADHFFGGRTGAVVDRCLAWLHASSRH